MNRLSDSRYTARRSNVVVPRHELRHENGSAIPGTMYHPISLTGWAKFGSVTSSVSTEITSVKRHIAFGGVSRWASPSGGYNATHSSDGLTAALIVVANHPCDRWLDSPALIVEQNGQPSLPPVL